MTLSLFDKCLLFESMGSTSSFFSFFWDGHLSTYCFNIQTLLCLFFLFFSHAFGMGFFSIAHTSLFGI
jgi:hypothetical protein